ncbi:hypothetical protein Dimus_013691, partial [Dionaea muscipula]
MPLNSGIKVLRIRHGDVPLSLKYQTTTQDLIPVDNDVEIVGSNPIEMEVDVNDNSVLIVGDNGEVYGIDDVIAFVDIAIEDAANKIFEDTADQIDIELIEELVDELEKQEVAAAEKEK